jgi:hypothetical protein
MDRGERERGDRETGVLETGGRRREVEKGYKRQREKKEG